MITARTIVRLTFAGSLASGAAAGCGDDGGTVTSDSEGSSTGASTSSATASASSTSSTGTTSSSGTSSSTGAGSTSSTSSGTSGEGSTGREIVDPLADRGEVEPVESGFQFTEGPVWLDAEGVLMFTDIPADTIYRWDPTDGVSIFESASGANANGLTLDTEGNLVACEHATRRVTRRTTDGTEVIADAYTATAFNSPNDAVVHPNGTVYFTDPTYGGNPEDLGFRGVFRVPPGGDPVLVSDDHVQPNGIVLSPDADLLYVADTPAGTVTVYPVEGDGTTGIGTPFADVADGVDGMAIDIDGNLYVTSAEGVVVLRPDGERWGVIAFPQQPANCTFGDADRLTLYVTARTTLYSVRLGVPGLPPPT